MLIVAICSLTFVPYYAFDTILKFT